MRNPDLLGPILVWEMTTVGRRARYFILRILYCLFLTLLLWSVFQSTLAEDYFYGEGESTIHRAAYFANSFFWSYSFAQVSAILMLAPAYVAASIVVEKERRTIEYLFASPLTNREIVLGKWAARSLNLFMLILAGIPILSFASFFGGIGLDRIFYLAVLSVGTLVLVSGLSILISVYSRTIRSTLSNCYSLVILGLVFPTLLSVLGDAFCRWLIDLRILPELDYKLLEVVQWLGATFAYFHPFNVLYELNESAASGGIEMHVLYVFALHASAGLVFLVIAIARIRAAYRGQVSRSERGPKGARRGRSRRGAPPIKDDPMFWKEWYFGESRKVSLVGKILFPILLVGAYWFLVLAAYYRFALDARFFGPDEVNAYLRGVGTLAAALTLIVIAARSATSFGTERDKETWVTLLSTPLNATEIIWAKFRGSQKPLYYYFLLVSPAWLLGILLGGISLLALPGMVLVMFIYASFVASLGIFQSLRRKTTGSALAATFLICVLLGGFGHMIGGIFLFPLTLLGLESETMWMLYATSVPWVILASVPFRVSDFRGDFSNFVGCILFWIAAYAVVSTVLYQWTVLHFERLAPRLTLGGSPTPAKLPPLPSYVLPSSIKPASSPAPGAEVSASEKRQEVEPPEHVPRSQGGE